MLFEVRANAKRKAKVLFAQILCGLCIVGIFCFLRLDFMADYFKTDPFAYGLFVSFMAVFILMFVVTCYCGIRPRICVDEQTVTIYPLFRRAKQVTIIQECNGYAPYRGARQPRKKIRNHFS